MGFESDLITRALDIYEMERKKSNRASCNVLFKRFVENLHVR